MDLTQLSFLLKPFFILLGSYFLGFVFEKIIIKKLYSLANLTASEYDNLIIKSLRGKTIFVFLIAGVFLATLELNLPDKYQNIINQVLIASIIIVSTWFIANVAGQSIRVYSASSSGALPSASILNIVTKAIIIILGGLIVIHSFGISITPLITALGVGGLAVSLALQDTLSNLFSGMQIIFSRQIKPGDYIMLDSGEAGYVTDITWRTTTIRELPNNVVVIPNSKLSSAIVKNYNLPDTEMAVLVQVGVHYESDLEHVEKVTIEVGNEIMQEVEGGVTEFAAFTRYNEFADSSINFTVILRAKEFVNQYLIKHEFIKRLHKKYKEEKITIPYPIRTIEFANNLECKNSPLN
ncbi:MAG: mechanosensitive ion channel family protein [Candidatus Caenarcaniphilales bacterium]|nr:mechanosensitive ion channel family protein [Candidatus Caenarcaniphilales bacterium]